MQLFDNMRKYQQLLLILISIISVTVLLVYKSENNRLKYVLQVVNFFGRNDAAVLDRLENSIKSVGMHDFSNPLPVWQHIGGNFHAYSSYWEKKELAAGGEAIAIVVSVKDALINFKCNLRYDDGKVITGKFAFVRIEAAGIQKENIISKPEQFSIYKFLCKVTRDFGSPKELVLTDSKSKTNYDLLLRHTKLKNAKERSLINACVNLVQYNASSPSPEFFSNSNNQHNLLQFFLFHRAIGIDEFLIYNADGLTADVRKNLIKAGIGLNSFPYNFPFDYKTPATRTIVELDCLMRNMNSAQFVVLLEANEFFLPGTHLHAENSVLKDLNHYDSQINRFKLPSFSVCMDHKNKILLDNTLYDPERKVSHTLSIYKPTLKTDNIQSKELTVSHALSHAYINCVSSKDLLYDWRSSVREDFLQFIVHTSASLKNEINFLF